MSRICLTGFVLAWLTGGGVGPLAAAPPPGYSPGPNPIFGLPGAYNPAQYSYPAPGVYGGTVFKPFAMPTLSTGVPAYNVPPPPAEWPAVTSARVTVRVPAEAKLWVDGKLRKPTWPARDFVTPPVLRAGLTYQYTFRAEWTRDGRPVTRERPVTVRATGSTDVDFTKP
jgi:uncharacterized protein (TIGR03000 family)